MNESNVSGKFDQVIGKVKQGVGETFDDQKLANEGAADQVKGNVKETWGDVKDTASDTGDTAAANSRATVATDEQRAGASGHNLRESITSAAEKAKESIQGALHGEKH